MRADAIADFVSARQLGVIQHRVGLRGRMSLSGGFRAAPELCLTDRGLWLVAARDVACGAAIDVLADDGLRYVPGRLADRLHVAGRDHGIATGKGKTVRRLLAIGRLRGRGAPTAPTVRTGRHVETPTEVAREWLSRTLGPDELLLGWLRTSTRTDVGSAVLSGATGVWWLLVTDRRAALVAFSEVGDVKLADLDESFPAVRRDKRRTMVDCGGHRCRSTAGNSALFQEIAGAMERAGPSRVLEVARRNWLERDAHASAEGLCRHLLAYLVDANVPAAIAARFLIAVERGEPDAAKTNVDAAVARLHAEHSPPVALADVWSDWRFGRRAGMALLDALQRLGSRSEPWGRELHRRIRTATLANRPSMSNASATDVAWAEHLLRRGDRREATATLEARLASFPEIAVDDLLPPDDLDLTRGAGTDLMRARKRVLQLLVEVRGEPDRPDVRALTDLAVLEPLVPDRLRRVAEAARGDLRHRAEEAWAVLECGAPRAAHDGPRGTVRPLSRELLEGPLRHPLGREGGALGRLLALLASVDVPDHAVLRDYCEALSPSQTAASGALRDAAVALGVRNLEGYVSRGRKGIGVRAYDAAPPFVLIGGRHLDDPELALSRAELDFALGAEIAHLRYGHGRVTSDEVWAGAWDKSRQGLDLALGLLPALRGWRLAERMTSRLRAPAVQQVLRGASAATEEMKKGRTGSGRSDTEHAVITRRNEELVAAHRVMQLTADRAGLLLAGDLRAAVRAMLLTRPDLRLELETVERDGLGPVLRRRSDGGRIAHQDLAMRAAALIGFYLSEDYSSLSRTLRGKAPEPPRGENATPP